MQKNHAVEAKISQNLAMDKVDHRHRCNFFRIQPCVRKKKQISKMTIFASNHGSSTFMIYKNWRGQFMFRLTVNLILKFFQKRL
jgi:hypothetical protein